MINYLIYHNILKYILLYIIYRDSLLKSPQSLQRALSQSDCIYPYIYICLFGEPPILEIQVKYGSTSGTNGPKKVVFGRSVASVLVWNHPRLRYSTKFVAEISHFDPFWWSTKANLHVLAVSFPHGNPPQNGGSSPYLSIRILHRPPSHP